MKSRSFLILILLAHITKSYSQDSLTQKTDLQFVPVVQVFGITTYNITDHHYRYWIDRAFLGFQIKFNDRWSTKVLIDRGTPTSVGGISVTDSAGNAYNVTNTSREGAFYTMYLKLATLRWNVNDKLTLEGGVILQNHYITQDHFWKLRYVAQTFSDRYYSMAPTDLGFIGYYKINKTIAIDAAVTNGEGPRFDQDLYGKVKFASGIDIQPYDFIQFRIYYHYKPSGESTTGNENFISFFSGIRPNPKTRLGVEYNYMKNLFAVNELKSYGWSLFGVYSLSKQLEIFGRGDRLLYENVDLEQPGVWGNGITLLAGISESPVNGISLSIAYQYWRPDRQAGGSDNRVRFSIQIMPEF